MPIDLLGHQENSLVSHCMDVVSLHEWEQSSEKNLKFVIDSINSNEFTSTPDFQGYNHKGIHRDCANKGTELPIQKRVTVQYLPLIDHAPTDPSHQTTANPPTTTTAHRGPETTQ